MQFRPPSKAPTWLGGAYNLIASSHSKSTWLRAKLFELHLQRGAPRPTRCGFGSGRLRFASWKRKRSLKILNALMERNGFFLTSQSFHLYIYIYIYIYVSVCLSSDPFQMVFSCRHINISHLRCVRTYTHISMHRFAHTHTYTCMYIYIYIYIYTHLCIDQTFAPMYVYIYIYIPNYAEIKTFAHVYMCVYKCINLCIDGYIYIYIYTCANVLISA